MSNKQQVTVVDFSNGHYMFGYPGATIRKSIYEKTRFIQQSVLDLTETIKRELGTDIGSIAAMLVAMEANTGNEKVRYIKSMVKRVSELTSEAEELSSIARGMEDGIVYTLSVTELKKFGL